MSPVTPTSRNPCPGAMPHGAGRGVARLEPDQRLAGPEGVRRAGHRLDGEAAAAHVGQRVAREEHQVRVALVDPEREPRVRLGVRELDAGEAVRVALEVGEGVVEPVAPIGRGRRKSYSVPSTGSEPVGRPRSSESQHRSRRDAAGSTESTVAVPTVRYGCAPLPYGHASGADVRRRRPHARARRSESAYSMRERERERVARAAAGARAPSRPGRGSRSPTVQGAQRTRPWIAFPRSGSVERQLVASPVELVARRPRAGSATGSAPARGPTCSARRRRSRRGRRGRRPSTSAARRRPRRRRRAGRRTRSRPARPDGASARRCRRSAPAARAGGRRRGARWPSPSAPG